jgi:hypothetical protein
MKAASGDGMSRPKLSFEDLLEFVIRLFDNKFSELKLILNIATRLRTETILLKG